MVSGKLAFASAGVLLVGAFITVALLTNRKEDVAWKPTPGPREKQSSGTAVHGTRVGTGSGLHEEPGRAAQEAVSGALNELGATPADFAIVFITAGDDVATALSAACRALGPHTKIYGGTSDSRGVLTGHGYVRAARQGYYDSANTKSLTGVAVMAISSSDIVFGVGTADLNAFDTPQEAGRAATADAVRSAGRTSGMRPAFAMTTISIGHEEEVLEGVESVLGTTTPILGGTAGGPQIAVFDQDIPLSAGVCVATAYTDLPVGWTFERGFDVADPHSGIATQVDGQAIVTIDGRPALDVYDEWLGGRIAELHDRKEDPGSIRDLLTLHPLYRKFTSSSGQDFFLFSHPWPKDDTLQGRGIATSTQIAAGERVHLSHGTWETLINRIGNLPVRAKVNGSIPVDDRPVLAIGYLCGGILGVIPDAERDTMPILLNYSTKGCPTICSFTWGEQGYFPGIGSKHGNLSTPFIVIGAGTREK